LKKLISFSVILNMGSEGSKHQESQVRLPRGSKLMDRHLQERNGAMNMKVVIRGDRETGKSVLLRRLEGLDFLEEHYSTSQIQSAHVSWFYKVTDEMVKLEVWDVVDKGRLPPMPEYSDRGNLNVDILPQQAAADASTVDVYSQTHAVIFMVDPCRRWTLKYVAEKLVEIPSHIVDILVIVGFKDVSERHVLTSLEIAEFIAALPRPVRWIEASLKNAFGLRELYTFFNIPFLRMKKRLIQERLLQTQQDLQNAELEVDTLLEHRSYEQYCKMLNIENQQKRQRFRTHPCSQPKIEAVTPSKKEKTRRKMRPFKNLRRSATQSRDIKRSPSRDAGEKKRQDSAKSRLSGRLDNSCSYPKRQVISRRVTPQLISNNSGTEVLSSKRLPPKQDDSPSDSLGPSKSVKPTPKAAIAEEPNRRVEDISDVHNFQPVVNGDSSFFEDESELENNDRHPVVSSPSETKSSKISLGGNPRMLGPAIEQEEDSLFSADDEEEEIVLLAKGEYIAKDQKGCLKKEDVHLLSSPKVSEPILRAPNQHVEALPKQAQDDNQAITPVAKTVELPCHPQRALMAPLTYNPEQEGSNSSTPTAASAFSPTNSAISPSSTASPSKQPRPSVSQKMGMIRQITPLSDIGNESSASDSPVLMSLPRKSSLKDIAERKQPESPKTGRSEIMMNEKVVAEEKWSTGSKKPIELNVPDQPETAKGLEMKKENVNSQKGREKKCESPPVTSKPETDQLGQHTASLIKSNEENNIISTTEQSTPPVVKSDEKVMEHISGDAKPSIAETRIARDNPKPIVQKHPERTSGTVRHDESEHDSPILMPISRPKEVPTAPLVRHDWSSATIGKGQVRERVDITEKQLKSSPAIRIEPLNLDGLINRNAAMLKAEGGDRKEMMSKPRKSKETSSKRKKKKKTKKVKKKEETFDSFF